MKEWFGTFVKGLASFTWLGWFLTALLFAAAIGLPIVLKKRGSQKWLIPLWLIAVGAVVASLLFSIPEVEVEEGTVALAGFLYNPVFWAVLIGLGGLALLFLLLRRQEFTARMLSTGALCVTLAFVLSCLTLWRLPNGGSITPASMLPVFVFSYLYGPVPGIAAGTVNGLLQLVQGAYVVHPVQFLLDYILPFAILGCAGLFRKEKQFPIGIFLGSFLRFVIHVISGVVFFYMYAEGQNVWAYSILYNGSYMLPEAIICLAVAFIPSFQRSLVRLRTQFAK